MVLPFRAADAGVNRQHYHVHVSDVATLERDGHAGEVLRSGGAHAHTLEVLRAIALGEVVALAARLLEKETMDARDVERLVNGTADEPAEKPAEEAAEKPAEEGTAAG